MEKDKEITEVQFRILKGEVIAVFPYEIYNIGGKNKTPTVNSYMHNGQHSGCDWNINNFTKKATPEQYTSLLNELESNFGYNLKVIQRRNHSKFLDALVDKL